MLSLTCKTVANYYQSTIEQKLGVEISMRLLRVAMEHGMVSGEPVK